MTANAGSLDTMRPFGGKAKVRRRSGGLTILIRTLMFFLCLIGLAGCPSPSSNSAGGGSATEGAAPGSPSSSSGCFLSAYVRHGSKPGAVRQVVLTAAQFPSAFVPDPDIDIVDNPRPLDGDQQDEETWADEGESSADKVPLTEGVQAPTRDTIKWIVDQIHDIFCA
jgi:hypothetical protein